MKTGIILISHGSKLSTGNEGLFKVADMLRAMNRWDRVEAAFLQLAEPGFGEVVKKIVEQGIDRIVVVPLLLFRGNHVYKDIPEMLELEKSHYPQVEFIYANNIGADERIALIAADRIHEVLIEKQYGNKLRIEQPQAIVDESFDIIDKLVDLESVPELHRPVIRRAIHAAGDTEYAYNLVFHPQAVEAGIRSVREGKNIVTDVNMVRSGISGGPVEKFGGKIICKIGDKSVIDDATRLGKTRAIMAMQHSVDEMKDGVVVIGNAPTALFELIQLIKKGQAQPALVVGIPVGFVGAVEAKYALKEISVPYITNTNRKGGSAVAASVMNAMIQLAKDMEK
ncbi:MAG: precorrin-8X methylmutase [Candidatus Loosdrechtia sp.]|uniref:precorrin-8X methylmutase n=1 Tax=Candidatus Loosdrechtia sp. TaxID=3101272 RepID=UPI003A751C95|nr:MAG: precorrin-8X methylmutase [Candidatus Jettenia sp. AMX2]